MGLAQNRDRFLAKTALLVILRGPQEERHSLVAVPDPDVEIAHGVERRRVVRFVD